MMTLPYALKRQVKSARNLLADPLPRNACLTIEKPTTTAEGLAFHYSVRGETFTIHVSLPEELRALIPQAGEAALAPALTAVALAFAPFFFKLTNFRTVTLRSTALDQASATFFGRFIQHGLGEFRYLQGLDPRREVQVSGANGPLPAPLRVDTREHVLMLNGGGKDTIVAGELLTRAGLDFTWLTIRPNAARRAVVDLSGNARSLEIGYEFDPRMERKPAYPWGHFPHTSLVLSLGVLTAQLLNIRYVCAGNESSSNHGNLIYRGFEVNHQYTKSYAYESAFLRYVQERVSPDIVPFSILRPFNDLQLARLFSRFPRYHQVFISCNRGISRNEWCKSCPKCAFTALALYPFLASEGIRRIFGEDILQRPVIRRHIVDLASSPVKPWECVGTQEESKLALGLLLARHPELEYPELPRRAQLQAAVGSMDLHEAEKRFKGESNPEHGIPEAVATSLNRALDELDAPRIVT